MSIKGKIHSLESFGAADGPGVRFVVFLKGCDMRCKYCHNPDSWASKGGEEWTAEDLIAKIMKYQSYWGKDGGLTVSGGEPLLQIDFLIELLSSRKRKAFTLLLILREILLQERNHSFQSSMNL